MSGFSNFYNVEYLSERLAAVCKERDELKRMLRGCYTKHEVACIIAELFGDDCACNFNGIDEWLPEKCEVIDACPYPVGVACWEQYLKFREVGERHG